MRHIRFHASYPLLFCLSAVFLIAAGFSRYLETDSGNILIHDIDIESYEGFNYGGRLFRPLQASSMNQRPSVLLIPGNIGNRYTCDHIAMELARRGFAALTMENFSQGLTESRPEFDTENLIDTGFTFLSTRSFTDHERIALAAFYDGSTDAAAAVHLPDFASRIFISPLTAPNEKISPSALTLYAKFETKPDYIADDDLVSQGKPFYSTHEQMLIDHAVIAEILERFHKDLSIPNDSPFWFSSASQHAQLLVFLRLLLLVLSAVICIMFSTLITGGKGKTIWHMICGTILPLILFLLISEVMNFFLISVRLGSPFRYLPKLTEIRKSFSLLRYSLFIAGGFIWSMTVRIEKRKIFVSDIITLTGAVICLSGILSVVLGIRSVWSLPGFSNARGGIILGTELSCLMSLLLRIPRRNNKEFYPCVFISGMICYIISCRAF